MYQEDFDLETTLLARMRQGDEGALAELYERLNAKVYTLVFQMLQSKEEAEEVLQDTFFKLFKGQDSFTTWDRSPRAFIYTVARNEAISRIRKRQARPQKADAIDVHDPDLSLALETQEDNKADRLWLEAGLSQLASDERNLLEQSYFLGYSHAELVEMTEMPLGTIKSKIRRALQKLKGCLENQKSDDTDSHDEPNQDRPSQNRPSQDAKRQKPENRDHA
jgi:RNA polymerase sigma-70 factor, ECF subfamily